MKKIVFGIFLFSFGVFSAQIDGPLENSSNNKVKGLNVSPVENNKEICLCCNKDVKIKPLIIVDGERIPYEDFNKIDPNAIESVQVLKNEKAIELYGEDAKNGVIIVIRKET